MYNSLGPNALLFKTKVELLYLISLIQSQCLKDLKILLLEINSIQEMRTTSGNKEVPQTLFYDFPY